MMPTNEERHTIAEEMRQRMREGYSFVGFRIAEQIGMYEADYDDPYEFDENCWNRLADLIDPTCEVHRDKVFKPAVLYPDRELDDVGREETVFRCCKCCEIVSCDEDYNPETDAPAYCETCGSRIIGIGEPWDE